MPGRKKTFACGHRGRGQYCHRCRQEEQQKEEARHQKRARAHHLASAPVPLDHLPEKVALKALKIMRMIESGSPYTDFRGKRLRTMGLRHIISIPVGWSYRLICRETEGRLRFVEVISHETYNTRIDAGGWG